MKRTFPSVVTFVLVTLLFPLQLLAENPVPSSDVFHLIPAPKQVELESGGFVLTSGMPVYTNLKGKEKRQLLEYLRQSPLALSRKGKKNTPGGLRMLITTNNNAGNESYRLHITPSGIILEAPSGEGIFHGLQTLLQIASQYGSNRIPSALITDSPYLPYRGLMLDVSRHFFSTAFIKKQLDMMAYYKLNRFHWHLVDGAGWRIQIKKYPELTRKAAWRPYESIVEWSDHHHPYCERDTAGTYGGYYTQKEIKEIVKYAAQRYITIIPEIEMPGHSEEVLTAFPQLSCSGKPHVNSDYCVGNPETFTFLENVLTEVMKLFPSKYIHIGGDEAGKQG